MGTNGDTKMLLFKALSSCFPYGVMAIPNQGVGFNASEVTAISNDMTGIKVTLDGSLVLPINMVKPYLRPLSSMTEDEKKDLLVTIVGNKGSKYFRVLQDGSIDNTDAAIQDLNKFNMHWVNFDKDTVTSYFDWLNKKMFDYRGLIPKGLAISTEEFNPYKD